MLACRLVLLRLACRLVLVTPALRSTQLRRYTVVEMISILRQAGLMTDQSRVSAMVDTVFKFLAQLPVG